MSVKIKYNNKTTNVPAGKTATLACVNKTMVSNVEVTVPSGMIVPSGTEDITVNGTYDIKSKASVKVQVPIPTGYIKPTGTKSINTLGETDVTEYAKVNVSLPEGYVKPEEEIEITQNGTYNTVNVKKAIVNLTLEPYDAFWDTYQDNGQRTDYSCAFSGIGWTDETFKPKYDIVPSNAYMIFRNNETNVDLVEHLDNRGVKLDLSQSTSTQYLFYRAKFTRIGVVDVRSSTNSVPLDNAFGGNSNLVTIDKIVIKTGSTGEFNRGTFESCSALKNLTIEGTINKNGLDLQWSTKLSKTSIESIINALSTTTSGLSVTLSKAAVDNGFTGENLLQVIPNTTTSGTNETNTIYLTQIGKGAVCGMAKIVGGKSYTIKRNLTGKEWRYFFYDTEPLNTGATSIGGKYLANPYSNHLTYTFKAPENAKYVVVRGAEGLTEEEIQNFELTCGVAGSESTEWLNLIDTKSNWTKTLI